MKKKQALVSSVPSTPVGAQDGVWTPESGGRDRHTQREKRVMKRPCHERRFTYKHDTQTHVCTTRSMMKNKDWQPVMVSDNVATLKTTSQAIYFSNNKKRRVSSSTVVFAICKKKKKSCLSSLLLSLVRWGVPTTTAASSLHPPSTRIDAPS